MHHERLQLRRKIQSALVGMLVGRRLRATSQFHTRFRSSAFWQGFAVLGVGGAAFPLLQPLFSQSLLLAVLQRRERQAERGNERNVSLP